MRVSRRQFLKTTASGALLAGASTLPFVTPLHAAENAPESLEDLFVDAFSIEGVNIRVPIVSAECRRGEQSSQPFIDLRQIYQGQGRVEELVHTHGAETNGHDGENEPHSHPKFICASRPNGFPDRLFVRIVEEDDDGIDGGRASTHTHTHTHGQTHAQGQTHTHTHTQTHTHGQTHTHSQTHSTATGQVLSTASLGFAFALEDDRYRGAVHRSMYHFEDLLWGGADRHSDSVEAGQPADKYCLLPDPVHDGPERRRELQELLDKQETLRRELGGPSGNLAEEIRRQVTDISSPFLDTFRNDAGVPTSLLRMLAIVEQSGLIISAHFKNHYRRMRPHIAEARLEPLITTPNHSSYPSGHATQAYLLAHAMTEIMGDRSGHVAAFFDIAQRIAVNREWAGVHYASDSRAGQIIAQTCWPVLKVLTDPLITQVVHDMNVNPEELCEFENPQTPGLQTSDPAEAWHLKAVGLTDADLTFGGQQVTIGLFDTAVDLFHPAYGLGSADPAFEASSPEKTTWFNLDYPAPRFDTSAFQSRGDGHGTAMAGLMVGRPSANYQLTGVAPEANLFPVRLGTYVSDSHSNRMAIAVALLEAVFTLEKRANIVLLGPVFERPLEDYAQAYGEGLVDPLILAILIAQTRAVIVLPAGNNGSDTELSYPSDPADYGHVFRAIATEDGLTAALDMLFSGLSDDVDPDKIQALKSGFFAPGTTDLIVPGVRQLFEGNTWIATQRGLAVQLDDALAQAAAASDEETDTADQAFENFGLASFALDRGHAPQNATDPFAGTGIINVGAAKVRRGDLDQTEKAAYSQSGWGVTLLAPSAAEYQPYERCSDELPIWHTSVPTADTFGAGGYSADQHQTHSHDVQRFGFGGTSAASAIVAGLLARIAGEDASLRGPSLRNALLTQYTHANVADYDNAGSGYGFAKKRT